MNKGSIKHVLWLVAGLGPLILVVGCAASVASGEVKSDKERLEVTATEEETAELVAGNSAFAFNLYQQLKGNDSNLFYSPYSISMALAMTYAGARSGTEAEMADTLHFEQPQPLLHPTFNALDTTLNTYGQGDDDFQLNVANAIWGQEGYEFLPEFLDLLAEQYGAGLRTLDFGEDPEGAAEIINNWISDKTEGKIEDLISPGLLNSSVRLVLTNAIYFNGKWMFQFEEDVTHDEPFTLLDGSQETVRMMSQTEPFLYTEGDGYQAVSLPYQGAPISMLFILPAEGRFTEIEETFSTELLDEIERGFATQMVELSVPKFTFESEFNLSETLAEMGMPSAFSGEADFSGMTGARDLFISDVVHKAFVAVDEEGTEAAAATAVIMAEMAAAPIEDKVIMKLDRPFLFLIRDNETGTVLFAGRLVNPDS
jgi:serpin B